MINDRKVIIVIPSGRKQTLSILLKYIEKELDIIDEIRFWLNTSNSDDVSFIQNYIKENNKCSIDLSAINDKNLGNSRCISLFFKNCVDENSIYLRFDDDIVFLEENFIKDFIKFRIENPEPFLILGNIINNSVCDFSHKVNGALRTNHSFIEDATCKIGWGSPELAIEKHLCFFENYHENNLHLYKMDNKRWNNRFSINVISWMGNKFKEFDGNVQYADEEVWLTNNRQNLIFGGKVASHYSFWVQKELIDRTDILHRYKNLLN